MWFAVCGKAHVPAAPDADHAAHLLPYGSALHQRCCINVRVLRGIRMPEVPSFQATNPTTTDQPTHQLPHQPTQPITNRNNHQPPGSYGLGPWYFDMEERLHNPYFIGGRAWNGPIEGWVGKNKVRVLKRGGGTDV